MATHNKEKVCQTCGGYYAQFEDSLATCSKCNAYVHGYCMQEVMREVPEDWVCESCVSGNDMVIGASEDTLVTSSKAVHRNSVQFSGWQVHSKKQRHVETGKVKFLPHEEAKMLSSGVTKTRSPLRSAWNFKPGSTSKRTPPKFKAANPRSFYDRMKTTTCKRSGLVRPFGDDAMHKSTMVNQRLSQTNELKAPERTSLVSWKWHAPQKQQMAAFSVSRKDVDTSRNKMENLTKKSSHALVSSRPVDPEKRGAAPYTKEPVTKKKLVDALYKEPVTKNKLADALILPQKIESSKKKIEEELIKDSRTLLQSRDSSLDLSAGEHKHSNVQDGDLQNLRPSTALYLTYLPASDATWKGGFSVLDWTPSEVFSGFQAQPSCKVHRKGYEISQKMPPVLQVKLVPQFHLLADLFQDDSPDLLDVALYFFPTDDLERSRQNYVQLFKHMDTHGSIMISYINDVELLIFTSKQLNMESQNILSLKFEHFFWGVFRRMEEKALNNVHEELPLLVSPLACSNGNQAVIDDNMADEDMEIDMVGGKSIGRVDVVVPRSTELSKTIQDGVSQKLDTKGPISRERDSPVQQLCAEVERKQRKDDDKISASTHLVGSLKRNQERIPSSPPGFRKKIKSEPVL